MGIRVIKLKLMSSKVSVMGGRRSGWNSSCPGICERDAPGISQFFRGVTSTPRGRTPEINAFSMHPLDCRPERLAYVARLGEAQSLGDEPSNH